MPASKRRGGNEGRQYRELLSAMLQKLGNPKYDVLIVGDGSGTGWATACGWACTLVIKNPENRRFFYGGMDTASINMAESMPYLHALTWYDNNGGYDRLKLVGHLDVLILTDSEVTANWGNQAMQPYPVEVPRKQVGIYAALREYGRLGYNCKFVWIPRQSNGFNYMADLIAGITRRTVIAVNNDMLGDVSQIATRTAQAIDNMVVMDPNTKQVLTPYAVHPTTEA